MPDDALPVGAYSELVTDWLEALLVADPDLRSRAVLADLRSADASDRYGRHIASVVARLIASLEGVSRTNEGAGLLGGIIDRLDELLPASGALGGVEVEVTTT